MTLKALQTIRRGVFAVSGHYLLFPERLEAHTDRVRLPNDTSIVIGTAFLADQSGTILITARHVITDFIARTEAMRPRFESGELDAMFRRPLLVIQKQVTDNSERPPEMGPDGANATAVSALIVAAIGYLLDSVYDLAALYLAGSAIGGGAFDPAVLALAPGEANLGDEVVACGYPFGSELNRRHGVLFGNPPTFTRGMVGAILPEWSAHPSMRSGFRFDATILPGNSGGPVCDSRSGKVVGVVSSVTVTRVQHLGHNMTREHSAVPVGLPHAVPLYHLRAFLQEARARRDDAVDFANGPIV
ncbi:MAG: S1 family peptidase [Gemmatimonadaceae bacterium]